ncbi:hypothetical protein F4825DRAFT_346869 [Nemania diffusa]|nr:hypothetical protein F4825DRAFT_346869 [Nemania diffusa]
MGRNKSMSVSNQPDTQVEEGRDELPITGPEQGQCCLRRLCNSPMWNRRAPSPKTYPPISSIPKMSSERLALAAVDADLSPEEEAASAKTILYLAYGSNLCAETFLGRRGIRPLSQINVSAPAFDLCFDLPGIPYNEPCFANTRPRKIPIPIPKPPVPGEPPKLPPSPPHTSTRRRPSWSKGLYGVVYEVTPEDYATIIKTEGGGQGYHDVLTPCFELPPALHVPEKPSLPDLPGKPFLAHTLYAPSLPDLPGDDDDDDTFSSSSSPKKDGDDKDEDKKTWLRRLLQPVHRPRKDYAQPSPRYLKLLRDGAREHALPDDYQAYLAAHGAYTPTTPRQQIGRVLFVLAALPAMLILLTLGRVLADGEGRSPRWLGLAAAACMNLHWGLYDCVFEPVFGDGERTISEGEGRRVRRRVVISADVAGEKNRLLADW